jgi:tight adherence protein B
VLREYWLGVELPDALQRMYDRLPCEDLQLLIVSIRLTLQSGGSLADVLQRITQTIRGRIEFQQKLKALTAQGRFEALAMSLAPLLAFVLLFVINNDLMLPMVQTLIGWCAIGVMLTLEIIGYFVIRAIVDVKV